MKVPNKPGLRPNDGLENAFLSDQSTAINPLLRGSDAQSDSSGADPASDSTVADSLSMPTTLTTAAMTAPRRSGKQHKPAAEYCKVPPAAPVGAQRATPGPPLCSFCLSMSAGSERGRSGRQRMKSCNLGHGMSLLCKRHTLLPRQRLHNNVEGAGPTAPSFWAAGTSASRGVALLFKACLLLSYATEPYGRIIAAQGNLSGNLVIMASLLQSREQECAPFFQQSPPSCHASRNSLIAKG